MCIPLPHVRAWGMGVIIVIVEPPRRDYSDCRTSEEKPECSAHELSKILENKGQPGHVLNGEGFSTLTPHLEKHPGQIRITQDIPV